MPQALTRTPRLMMTADAVGGVWTYATDLARSLTHAGIDVTLAILGPAPTADQRRETHGIAGLTVLDTGLALDWTAERSAELQATATTLGDLALKHGADLVHLNSPIFAAFRRIPGPILGVCHSCVATWWNAVRGSDPLPDDFRWRTDMLAAGLRQCDERVAPSGAFAEATARVYGIERPQIVHNGRADTGRAGIRRDRVVFTSGRLWDAGKNVGLIDEAAASLPFPVVAAGPTLGPNGAQIRLRHAVGTGPLPQAEVRAWLGRAPVFVSTTRYEPFGLGVLEAAQAGCALVLSDIPTFRELWDGAAIFVGPDDAGQLAALLRRLVGDPAEARRLGALARARASGFSLQAVNARLLRIYAELSDVFRPIALREVAA